jgi:hypothetical protein
VLSEREKQELREMAASENLREEFRAMRVNSEAIERTITVDELAHWLTVMARMAASAPKPRQPGHYAAMKL